GSRSAAPVHSFPPPARHLSAPASGGEAPRGRIVLEKARYRKVAATFLTPHDPLNPHAGAVKGRRSGGNGRGVGWTLGTALGMALAEPGRGPGRRSPCRRRSRWSSSRASCPT